MLLLLVRFRSRSLFGGGIGRLGSFHLEVNDLSSLCGQLLKLGHRELQIHRRRCLTRLGLVEELLIDQGLDYLMVLALDCLWVFGRLSTDGRVARLFRDFLTRLGHLLQIFKFLGFSTVALNFRTLGWNR